MGTSFVDFKGHGFWSSDGYLEHTLFLLAESIGPSPEEAWLGDVRDHWQLQALGNFNGWIHPKLDEYVTGAERGDVILRLIGRVISREDATPEVKRTAELLRRLLIGEITTDASSPLDYVVSGEFPYEWSVHRDLLKNGS